MTNYPHRLPLVATALAVGLLAFPAAHAQKQIPGLWEITMQTKSGSGQAESAIAQMQEQLAKLPPDQRKMMEEMMAKQGVGKAGAGGLAIRVCITKEEAERAELPQDPKGNCKNEITERSGSGMKFKYSCSSPPSSGSGDIVFQGDKAYTMKMLAQTTMQGKPERIEMTHSGRWVAADCGNLKR